MKNKKPIKIITLDTETYNGLIGDLKRIAVYDGLKVTYGYTFLDVEPVLKMYSDAGFDVHVYIHNLEFDARKIPELFSDGRVIWNKSFVIKGKLATIATHYYTIHDSFKLLPMSLKKLSKGFNVEHGKLDLLDAILSNYPEQYTIYDDSIKVDENLDLEEYKIENNRVVKESDTIVNFLDKCDKDDPIYLEYLGYDVISLYEVIQKLIAIADIPERDFVKRISTASLSRYLFKHGYKGKPIKNPFNEKTDYEYLCSYKWHFNLEVEEFIRASYAGGRVEVFKPILDHNGYHYDVNSLYPYVMADNGGNYEYPIGKPRHIKKPKMCEMEFEKWHECHNGLGFLNCHVFVPEQDIPPLPVFMGKLVFPCGHLYGTWTYEEIEYAINNCGVEIVEYYEAVHFDNTYPVFKNFIDTFYQLKIQGEEEKNDALRTLAKLILNVAYGYTGMRRDDKTSLDDISNYKEHKEIIFTNTEFGFIEVPTEIQSEYIQVQVASYVTSRARLVLLKALKDASSRGNVYYCDTDSIVTDVPLSDTIVDSKKLGFWKLEGQPLKALFLRPKVYTEVLEKKGKLKTEVKFKGVSKDTQESLDFSFYESLLSTLQLQNDKYVIVEKNKLMQRSIMYMQKKGLDFDYYETRDKKMNINTIEKREMNYNNNVTKAHFFDSIEAFENFSFKPPKNDVDYDMTK